jgi:nitroreductase
MKNRILSLAAILLISVTALCQNATSPVTDLILSSYSERAYTTVPVTDQQLEVILKCGIKAPSAVNAQPWRFTVIRDEATVKQIIRDALPGNVLIVISGAEPKQGSASTADFDCGLATESMFIAAHGLGLGARIYGSPAAIVTRNRVAYQIPEGFSPLMVLRVGNVDKSVDAVSAASPRKTFDEVVNYKK